MTSTKFDEVVPAAKCRAFDAIIDLRSGDAYREDHIPTAVNVPLGQEGDDEAPAGLAFASTVERVAQMVAGKERVLIYSNGWSLKAEAMAEAIKARGICGEVYQVDGGYIGYREWLDKKLKHLARVLKFNVIIGSAGCGKTALLETICAEGAQAIDLQRMIHEYGGAQGAGSRAHFLSQLSYRLRRMDRAKPVWVEFCSGTNVDAWLTNELRDAFLRPEHVYLVSAPMDERIRVWGEKHAEFKDKPVALVKLLQLGGGEMSVETAEELEREAATSEWSSLIGGIIGKHYDERHKRKLAQMAGLGNVVKLALARLDQKEIRRAARALLRA